MRRMVAGRSSRIPDRKMATVCVPQISIRRIRTDRWRMDQQDKLALKGQETGIRKFREKVRQENGNKLIVFDGDRYAIFDTYEVFILCGTNVRKPTGVAQVITKTDILRKYAALVE